MKILVVRYRFIGDMILTVPFLRNLRYAYPDAQIDLLVTPNSGEVIENCPYVDNFIYFDTSKMSKLQYVCKFRKEKYDKAYILKRSIESAYLCFFSGIKQRIGFDTEYRSIFLTKKVDYDRKKQEALCFLDVLKADNIPVRDSYLENWINEENDKKIDSLFEKYNVKKDTNKAVVNVTATNQGKVWDIENFAQIIEYLSNEKGFQVIFIGAPSDKNIYNSIKYSSELNIKPLNLCGEVNLKDSLALLKRVNFIFGNDSGNLHMASSVGTPVIGLYGPMPFEKWKAYGENNILIKADLPCMPCALKRKCKKNKACMKAISVEQVKSAIDKIISSQKM